MTAIVGILNKHGVAIAADSAVTLGGDKILLSANKLFALSKHQPVGIAVFGNAAFLGVPWEVVIKEYRAQRKETRHDSLELYALDFLSFLKNEPSLFPSEAQRSHLENMIGRHFVGLYGRFKRQVEKRLNDGTEMTEEQILALIVETLKKEHQHWAKSVEADGVSPEHEAKCREKYNSHIDVIIAGVFEKLPLPEISLNQLREIAVWLTCRRPQGMRLSGDSGIVIAGYGHKDVYPRLRSYNLFGMVDGTLNYVPGPAFDISDEIYAAVVPFAQSEMVTTFMEGMDPELGRELLGQLGKVFKDLPDAIASTVVKGNATLKKTVSQMVEKATEGVMDKFKKEFQEFRREKFSMPVVQMVASLPKDELSSMAEALVNLTSFKRHVSDQKETVGGPIDVAVISKGDGLIWIKRKHYFDPKLNHHFLSNYFSTQQ